ncbi:alpha-1,6-mannosyltransferase [Streptacidiphilus jiangxiensis]|uniref:Alpha-1,6-mannosyltransferase n=1 Tax=Streptacidiphilus jiangxiensis TaxID=235985 RepID=A0A1H7UBR4_STRJI|nr:alpha-1,6-mannosyltransferase [Streptacidiphilus jiangxiensis]
MALRIVRVANFVTPTSGGLRTALRRLGEGYLAAGHRPVLVVPGPEAADEETEQGRVVTVPGPLVPGMGGYRVLLDRARVAATLEALRPDRLEVSDRTTLRWTGRWAREHGVPAAMVSHESLDGVLRVWGLPGPAARRVADVLNARTARDYTRIICTTEWAAREFRRLDTADLRLAPLGVDLTLRHPCARDAALRAELAGPGQVLLVLCSRLSPEKRPERALDALAELRRRGVSVVLAIAGDGPLRARLAVRAEREGLPVRFFGHIADPARLSAVLASADVALAPGPVETFGLAALEALACGTPVVASASSALPPILGDAGLAAADDGVAFADAVQRLLGRPEAQRRATARARAERYGWDASVSAFLAAHEAEPAPRPAGAPASAPGSAPAGDAVGDAAEDMAGRADEAAEPHRPGWPVRPAEDGSIPAERGARLGADAPEHAADESADGRADAAVDPLAEQPLGGFHHILRSKGAVR